MSGCQIRPLLIALSAALTVAMVPAPALAAQPVPHPAISYHEWTTTGQFAAGTFAGAAAATNAVTFGAAVGQRSYGDADHPARLYNYDTWTSPLFVPGFELTELVASWDANTPAGTWLQVEMAGRTVAGGTTKWYVMGRWAAANTDIDRTSVGGQGDSNGTIAVDTFLAAKGVTLTAYRLRVTLYRLPSVPSGPTVRSLGALASGLPDDKKVAVSPLGGAEGITLDVPRYSQDVHLGEYPQYDGGGEAWCSPTSTEMVVEYYGKYPPPAALAAIPYADPSVDYAAQRTYDWHYNGTGNWPFNAAYAASYGLDAFVTQLRSLAEAERFIKAGIPLTASVSFKSSELDGAGYSTNGHLMDIVGFTRSGDVVVNDPVSPTDAGVRRIYNRAQFENVWLPASRSGGIVYVIHDAAHPLPPNMAGLSKNW